MLTQTESMGATDENGVALKERDAGPRANATSRANKGKRVAEAPVATANDGRHDSIKAALTERLAELRTEHAEVIGELAKDHAAVADAGDDAIDLGTKTFARDQEMALAVSIRERMDQVERAIERLAAGAYGQCEGCRSEIPVARLAAFPAATQCIPCKQREERR